MVDECKHTDLDEIVKIFFFNIIVEVYNIPSIELLMEQTISYSIKTYMIMIEELPSEEYEFRYLTILELLQLWLDRGVLGYPLLELLTETGFLTLFTSEDLCRSKT